MDHLTPCPSCSDPIDLRDDELESTWQQWRCPCCGSWNDRTPQDDEILRGEG